MSGKLQERLGEFNAHLPLARARTIPSSWYHDRDVHELERQRVFGDTWQVVGRADQVREPGSFFTANVAGEPVIVLRDEQGTLRAFYNVCRHRAALVIPEAEG